MNSVLLLQTGCLIPRLLRKAFFCFLFLLSSHSLCSSPRSTGERDTALWHCSCTVVSYLYNMYLIFLSPTDVDLELALCLIIWLPPSNLFPRGYSRGRGLWWIFSLFAHCSARYFLLKKPKQTNSNFVCVFSLFGYWYFDSIEYL